MHRRAPNRFPGLVGLVVTAGAVAIIANIAMADQIKIGHKMPDFKLTDHKGKEHTLAGYAGKIVVLDFCSQKCPWSRGADPSIVEIQKNYKEKGVVFLGIDSHRDTTVEEIKGYTESTKVPYPILKDEGNKYADAVKATRTPELYVIDKEGKLAYHGAFDNRRSPEKKGDVNYLTDALDEVLEGKQVSKPEVAAWGCTIKREVKEE
jgi:peroxiredoxin